MKSGQYRFFLLLAFIVLALIVSLTRSVTRSDKSPKVLNNAINTAINHKFADSVLVLDIASIIFFQPTGGSSLIGVRKWISQLDTASKDDTVKGLLVHMNSPGGSIVASQELFDAMKRFRDSGKPIVVSVADICASGGYYVSLPATKIIANKGSLIGSIGVRISNNDVSELLKKIGISSREIKSVPFKDILSPTRKMTAEERAYIQSLVDRMHEQFLADVIEWRGDKSNPKTLKQVANGLLYLSQEAIEYGLIDQIGNFDDAKHIIAEEIGIPYDELTFRRPSLIPWWESNFFPNIKALHEFLNLIQSLNTSLKPALHSS